MNYRIEQNFECNGFRCVVLGLKQGHRCGYIAIPKGHKFYGTDYEKIPIECHGGLSYSGYSKTYPIETEESAYWIGFDCAHCNDAFDAKLAKDLNADESMIKIAGGLSWPGAQIRTTEYCHDVLCGMAMQLTKNQEDI